MQAQAVEDTLTAAEVALTAQCNPKAVFADGKVRE